MLAKLGWSGESFCSGVMPSIHDGLPSCCGRCAPSVGACTADGPEADAAAVGAAAAAGGAEGGAAAVGAGAAVGGAAAAAGGAAGGAGAAGAAAGGAGAGGVADGWPAVWASAPAPCKPSQATLAARAPQPANRRDCTDFMASSPECARSFGALQLLLYCMRISGALKPRAGRSPASCYKSLKREWCPESDSNRRPIAYEAIALPLSYRGSRARALYLLDCPADAKPSGIGSSADASFTSGNTG